jgi:hypothetical protein
MPARKSVRRAEPSVPDLSRVTEAAHEIIRAVGPQLRLERRWGMPWYVGNDLVVLVGAFTRHVGVEFWRGTSLHDPSHLLEGTGKNLRHVKLRTVADATSPPMVALLREAIRLDSVEEKRPR